MKSAAIVGIDFGDSISLVDGSEGLLFKDDAVVAVDRSGKALAIGEEAEDYCGSSGGHVRKIISNGKIDFSSFDAYIEELLLRFRYLKLFSRPKVIVTYPSSFSEDHIAALESHLDSFDFNQVFLQDQIVVSAVGAGLNLSHSECTALLSLGKKNADIAVISNGKIIGQQSMMITGQTLEEILTTWFKSSMSLQLSVQEVRHVLHKLGSVLMSPHPASLEVTGMSLRSQKKETVIIDENQISSLLHPIVEEWAVWIENFIEELPLSYQQQISSKGIVCTGEEFEIKGLAQKLQEKTRIPFFVADHPAQTVTKGLQILINRMSED